MAGPSTGDQPAETGPSRSTAAVGRQQVTPPNPINRLAGRVGAYLAALAGLMLALHEISVLSNGFLTATGEHASFNGLSRCTFWESCDGWSQVLTDENLLGPWFWLLFMYWVLDVVFVIAYASGLWLLIRRVDRPRRRKALVVALGVLVAAEVVEDAGQLILGIQRAFVGDPDVSGELVTVVSVATTVKWLAVGFFVLAGVATVVAAAVRDWRAVKARRSSAGSTPKWTRVRLVGSALWIQRFSLLVFFPVAVLAVVPADELNNAFGQLPDVQRSWLDSWGGIGFAVVAGVVHSAVVIMVFLLGRIRSDFAARRAAGGGHWPYYDVNADGTRGSARLPGRSLWLVAPLVLIPLALIVDFVANGTVQWWRLAVFCAIPLLVLILWVPTRNTTMPSLPPRDERWPGYVMAVGDILAVTAASLAGLGAIRALTPVVALDWSGLLDNDFFLWPWLPWVIGVGLLVGSWLAAPDILADFHDRGLRYNDKAAQEAPLRARNMFKPTAAAALLQLRNASILTPGVDVSDGPGTGPTAGKDKVRLGMLALALFVFILLSAEPRFFAYHFGALASATLTLATLGGMLGAIVAYAQDRQPMPIFAWLKIFPRRNPDHDETETGKGNRRRRFEGFRASPFILLMFLTALATSALGDTFVHPVPSGTAALPPRPTLQDAFTEWEGQETRCTRPYTTPAGTEDSGRGAVPGEKEIRLRPMLMYAAEGGGIRASYWTAAALQTVATGGTANLDHRRGLQEHGGAPGCGARAALFSAGASGGSLGLTIGRWDNHPLDAVEAMAGQNALGVASIALVAGDLLASGAGIRFAASAPGRDPDPAHLDRAGFMETAWEHEDRFAKLQGTSYLPEDPADVTTRAEGTVTGQLILGSTSARDGCRVMLSQVDLSAGAPATTKSWGDHAWPTCPTRAAVVEQSESGTDDGPATGPDAYDVFAEFGRTNDDDKQTEDDHCLGNPPALTMGTLSARFPYVTPSGVVGECHGLDPTQLIDGGYADNTGLGIILNLAPVWTQKVRDHNDRVLDDGEGDLIVPMVVFLDNGSGIDYAFADQPPVVSQEDLQQQLRKEQKFHWPRWAAIPEVLVPIIGGVHASAHKVGIKSELRDAKNQAADALCSAGTPGCSELLASGKVGPQVIVVHQSPQPSIPAPLGWVLSEASQYDLLQDIKTQATTASEDLPNDRATKAGYGSLRDLLDALGQSPPDTS